MQQILLTLFLLRGTLLEQPKTVWHFHSIIAVVTKIHDLVYFSFYLVPVKGKRNLEKLKKIILLFRNERVSTLEKNWKNRFFCFFAKKSYYFCLNLNSTCSQLTFEVYNNCFFQNFQIFIFLAMKFPSITTFILWPLVAKIVIIGDYFKYLWTAKHQNIYLRSSFGHLEVFWQLYRVLPCRGPKGPPSVVNVCSKAQ